MKRAAAFSILAVVACGAARLETKKPSPNTNEHDGGSTAWESDACVTLASRETPLDVARAVIDGDLHKGKSHCYLDLQRALCVRFPSEDGGLDEVYVRTLRLPSSCDNNRPEVRFRGSVRGVIEPLGVNHPGDWTVDAQPASLERATHAVHVEIGDASAARKELLESFVLRCWRNASVASPTVEGRLAFDVVVAPSGDVTDVHAREAVSAPEAFTACVDKSIRAPHMFVETDAGASRTVSLVVTFGVSVSPL